MDSNAIANVPKPGTSLKQPTTASGAISRGVRYSIANTVRFLWQCLGIAVPDLHTGLVHHTPQQPFYGPLSLTTRVSQYPPPSWSSPNLYQLLPSTTIHSILPVQIACLAVFLHNLSPCPLWSTFWSGPLHLIFHTFLHPISVYFSQHIHIPSQPVLL